MRRMIVALLCSLGLTASITIAASAGATAAPVRSAPTASAPALLLAQHPGAQIIASRVLRPTSSAQSACQYTFDGDTGWFICGTRILAVQFSDGTIEKFGVGTDHAIWTALGSAQGTLMNSWASMGGQASDTHCAWTDLANNAVIQVVGPQGTQLWCRYLSAANGSWSSWFQCDNWSPGSHPASGGC